MTDANDIRVRGALRIIVFIPGIIILAIWGIVNTLLMLFGLERSHWTFGMFDRLMEFLLFGKVMS